jgi:hypothetical protein
MPKSELPKRPRGVRKHWKAEQLADLAGLGSFLMRSYLPESWGDPIEGRRYSYRGCVKRFDARFANGRVYTQSYCANGFYRVRMSYA